MANILSNEHLFLFMVQLNQYFISIALALIALQAFLALKKRKWLGLIVTLLPLTAVFYWILNSVSQEKTLAYLLLWFPLSGVLFFVFSIIQYIQKRKGSAH